MPQVNTPTTKPAVPHCDPPQLNLPPSLPKQSYLNVDGGGSDGSQQSDYQPAPIARSLTNNDHSLIPPSSMNNSSGIKMGQSPTIFSILSSSDNSTGMSYRAQGLGTSMVASSRTYASTTMPSHNNNHDQYPSQQPMMQQQQYQYHQQPYQQQQPINHYPPPQQFNQPMHNQIQDDDDMSDFEDDIVHDELPFGFDE